MSLSAIAQNSVTLYGVIDEGFDYTNNVQGGKVYELQSGYLQGSRWGLKGAEDLGGGLKAVFQLENGFNLNNGKLGQGGLEFGRQAYVGLSNDKFGTVTLGRQYDSLVDYLAQTTANGNWGGYLFAHPYDNDNTDNTFRVNNTLKYASPSLSGFQFGGTYSFSNDTNFANNRQYSVGAQYTAGVDQIGLDITPQNARRLATHGVELKDTINRQVSIRHPLYPAINDVAYVMFRHRVGDDVYQTCTTLPPGRVDRSPCGTGSSANLATLAARNLVDVGSRLTSRSTIGGEFKIDLLGFTEVGGKRAVLPRVHGRAWVYGFQQLGVDPDDPLAADFMLSDTWGAGFAADGE